MLMNISRLKDYIACPKKYFNRYHENLQGARNFNLIDGGAFHKGMAHGQATSNWHAAVSLAKEQVTTDAAANNLDEFEALEHAELVEYLLSVAGDSWQQRGMSVVQPECEFTIPIPNTEHYDITMHWFNLHEGKSMWGMPDPESIRLKHVAAPHTIMDGPAKCDCWRPHYLMGRADGILLWQGAWWLQEHKTTKLSLESDQFRDQWALDMQLTGYCYGIWQAMGIRPHGVVLNGIYKPSDKQVSYWQSRSKDPKPLKEYTKFRSDIYERTEADCLRFARDFSAWLDKIEYDILHGTFLMSPLSMHCRSYNTPCDYHNMCINHDAQDYKDVLSIRQPDYVDDARTHLYQILETTK